MWRRLVLFGICLLLAACSRQPDTVSLQAHVQQELAQTYGNDLFKVVHLQRMGSAQDNSAPAGETRRVVYFDIELKLQRDVMLGGWDEPGAASLVTLLGAGPRGITGVKSGGNQAGDVIEAHASAIYRKQGGQWALVTPAGLTTARAPSFESGAPRPVSRQLLDALNQVTQSVSSNGSAAAQRVVQQELERSVARIDGRLSRMQQGYPIAGGPGRGEYAALAQALAELGRQQGLRVTPLTTGGSAENIRLLRSGEASLALAQADAARMAYDGEGPFADRGPFPGIRTLGSLYPEMVHIVVRNSAGIGSVKSLKGKRIALGPSGSAVRTTLEMVLAAHGLLSGRDYQPVDVPFSQSLPLLDQGKIDATVNIIGIPATVLRDALSQAGFSLLPLNPAVVAELVHDHPGLMPMTIASGVYPNQRKPIATVGMAALLLTTSELTPDEAARVVDLVYRSGQDLLKYGSTQGAQIWWGTARRGLTVPLHKGADEALQKLETRPVGNGKTPPDGAAAATK